MVTETSDSSSRDIWLSPGVLAEEEPYIERNMSGNYKGVRIPFNLLKYLLEAELKAGKQGVKVNVATSGLGRIFEEYDFDVAKGLIEGDGTDEQKAFLEKIIKLEKVRNAVAEAVAEVLSFKQKGQIIGVAGEAANSAGFRSAVFENLEQLRSVSNGMIPFFGTQRMFGEIMANKALPRRLRRVVDDSTGNQAGADTPSYQYPLVEGAVAKHLITKEGGRYTVPRGSDFVDVEVGGNGVKSYSINECLREAVCGGFDKVKPGSRALLMQNWDIDPDLNGFAFYSDEVSSQTAKVCDPYYFPQTVSTDGKPVLVRVPVIPWESGFVGEKMCSERGGIFKGSAEHTVRECINPVLRHLFRHPSPSAEAALRMGHNYDNLQEWVRNPKQLMPNGFTIPAFNDLVRCLCQTVTERARAILGAE